MYASFICVLVGLIAPSAFARRETIEVTHLGFQVQKEEADEKQQGLKQADGKRSGLELEGDERESASSLKQMASRGYEEIQATWQAFYNMYDERKRIMWATSEYQRFDQVGGIVEGVDFWTTDQENESQTRFDHSIRKIVGFSLLDIFKDACEPYLQAYLQAYQRAHEEHGADSDETLSKLVALAHAMKSADGNNGALERFKRHYIKKGAVITKRGEQLRDDALAKVQNFFDAVTQEAERLAQHQASKTPPNQ